MLMLYYLSTFSSAAHVGLVYFRGPSCHFLLTASIQLDWVCVDKIQTHLFKLITNIHTPVWRFCCYGLCSTVKGLSLNSVLMHEPSGSKLLLILNHSIFKGIPQGFIYISITPYIIRSVCWVLVDCCSTPTKPKGTLKPTKRHKQGSFNSDTALM